MLLGKFFHNCKEIIEDKELDLEEWMMKFEGKRENKN